MMTHAVQLLPRRLAEYVQMKAERVMAADEAVRKELAGYFINKVVPGKSGDGNGAGVDGGGGSRGLVELLELSVVSTWRGALGCRTIGHKDLSTAVDFLDGCVRAVQPVSDLC
jgi:hypothetical protein